MSVTTQKMQKTILISKNRPLVQKPPISTDIVVIISEKKGLQAENSQLSAAVIEIRAC